MENATKAFMMAAGILFAILILALLIYAYNLFSNYQQGKVDAKRIDQIAAFNSEYEAYNRDDVTGIELFSLYQKILDYNSRIQDDITIDYGANEISTNIPSLLGIDEDNPTISELTSEKKGTIFYCTETKYDQNTERIKEINFQSK